MNLPSLHIDCSEFEGDMCRLGREFGCDRSPINAFTEGRSRPFRHAYTPVFEMLFARIRYQAIAVAELGIAYGAGLRMLGAYFPAARIVGFEKQPSFVGHCRGLALPRTEIRQVDLSRIDDFERGFDVVLEDSSHTEPDQVHAVETVVPALNPGGTLIIEDIPKARSEDALVRAVEPLKNQLALAAFVYPTHPGVDGAWQNDKLLVLVRR